MLVVTDDASLVPGLVRGDEFAYAELVARYHERLVGLALRFTGRRALAEDVVQDTWLAALSGMHQLADAASLRPWLFQICANKARSAVVREQRAVPVADLPAKWAAADGTERVDGALDVSAALDALTPTYRRALRLRYLDGRPIAEIAPVLGLSPAATRALLVRARRAMRAPECLGHLMRG